MKLTGDALPLVQRGLLNQLGTQGGDLATLGRDKVGFSVVGRAADGRPVHVEGLRGAVERNTLRYYLAVESYLGALALPAGRTASSHIAARLRPDQ